MRIFSSHQLLLNNAGRILSNRPLQEHSPNFKLKNVMLKYTIELDQKPMHQRTRVIPAHEAIMHPLVNIFRTASQQY